MGWVRNFGAAVCEEGLVHRLNSMRQPLAADAAGPGAVVVGARDGAARATRENEKLQHHVNVVMLVGGGRGEAD